MAGQAGGGENGRGVSGAAMQGVGCIDGYAEVMAATPEAIETATVMM